MRAIRVHEFGGPEGLRYEDVALPPLGQTDVLVRVGAAGVNPVDTYIRSGTYARLPALPYTPGSDGAGTVESVGAAIDDLAPGDRVYLAGLSARHSGTYADHVLCDRGAVHRLPDRVSLPEGAAIGVPYLTAARAVFDRARLEPGETMLVHGASGGVGLAALQMGRSIGARVIGSAGSARGAALVSDEGGLPVDHGTAGYERTVLELTGGRGADVIIEMLANVNLTRDFEMLATGGRIVVVGNRGSIDFNPRLTMAKEATILGTMLWNLAPDVVGRLFARVDAGLATGVLRPIVGQSFPLAEAAQAQRAVIGSRAAGKIVLVP